MKKIIVMIVGALFCVNAGAFANKVTECITVQKDTVSEYKKFRKDADQKIKKNEQRIAELKEKKQEGTQEVADKYNKKVADLEKRNMELKQRMTDYKADSGNEKWQSFKREFNHDMDELGKALKDVGTNNVK
jgi:peptidoglycan hydrolase CwlO-like protein